MLRKLVPGLMCLMLLGWSSSFAATGNSNVEQLRKQLTSPNYETRKAAVSELLETGQKRPLTKDEIDLLLPNLKSDSDWRIKVRIIGVLPYAADPNWVVDPLIAALKDTRDQSSGGGNVPSYACGALVKLGDARALQPMEDWLNYLKTNPNAYGELNKKLTEVTQQRIAALKTKLTEKK